jgi:1,3-beta-glucan synthase component
MQVGKGRDVGLNQISLFEAKIANGNGEQTLSRDIYRLGHRFDFFRMLSCYFTTVGFYFSTMVQLLSSHFCSYENYLKFFDPFPFCLKKPADKLREMV